VDDYRDELLVFFSLLKEQYLILPNIREVTLHLLVTPEQAKLNGHLLYVVADLPDLPAVPNAMARYLISQKTSDLPNLRQYLSTIRIRNSTA